MSYILEQEQVRRAQANFESHRERQLQTYYPEETLVDVSQDPLVESWSNPPLVINKLQELLPFSQVLGSQEYDYLVDQTLPIITEAAQEQLLYWHLSNTTNIYNYPVDAVLLWNSDTYVWFLQVYPDQDSLIRRILGSEQIRYLERFRLGYSEIPLFFHKICLVTQSESHQLIITEGREHTYQWTRSGWETTLKNPDHCLVNPEVHHFPPASLEEISLSRFSSEGATTQELPPSSPPSLSPSSADHWEEQPAPTLPVVIQTECWCEKEDICTCRYKYPNTPPTPPYYGIGFKGSFKVNPINVYKPCSNRRRTLGSISCINYNLSITPTNPTQLHAFGAAPGCRLVTYNYVSSQESLLPKLLVPDLG